MERHFYRIGEVSDMVDVPAHVLRYWENEFPDLKPQKGSGGQRLYKQADIRKIKEIQSLLYDQGFTIDGARKMLQSAQAAGPNPIKIDHAISELKEIAASLA